MNFYNATVRLAGDTSHEVNKAGLSAPEIMVLRRIHGLDAVVRISPVSPTPDQLNYSNVAERLRLRKLYCERKELEYMMTELFGPEHIPLPHSLDADEEVVAADAALDREMKEKNEATFTQAQIDVLIEKAMTKKLAELAEDGMAKAEITKAEITVGPDGPVDPDAPDLETGRLPDHVIAARDAKRDAGLAKKHART